MHQHYSVALTAPQRDHLTQLLAAGVESARTLTHARILLQADQGPDGPGEVDQTIAAATAVSRQTVARVRKRYAEAGVQIALSCRPPTRDHVRTLDRAQEARLMAIAGGEPPPGRARWSLRLLADQLVELGVVEAISYSTVRRSLHKNRVHATLETAGGVPPEKPLARSSGAR